VKEKRAEMEPGKGNTMWCRVSEETEQWRRAAQEAAYWRVIDREQSPLDEAVDLIDSRYDYGESRTPLEIYADTLMQERGFEEGSQTSPEILAKLRILQLRAVGIEEAAIIRDVRVRLPAEKMEPLSERDKLHVVAVGRVLLPTGYGAPQEESAKPIEVMGREIVIPDRAERDPMFGDWLNRTATEVAQARLVRVSGGACECGGNGLAGQLDFLTDDQQAEIGSIHIRYKSVQFGRQCLCCLRHRYFVSMYEDYGCMSERLRLLFWAAEEKAIGAILAPRLDPRQVYSYATTNSDKKKEMAEVFAEIMPFSSLQMYPRSAMEFQGTFSEVLRGKMTTVQERVIVDDAGFFDETGFPGPYSGFVYSKRPQSFSGVQRAVVTLATAVDEMEGVLYGVGLQTFDAVYNPRARTWSGIMCPEGVSSGLAGDLPKFLRVTTSPRARALRCMMRQMGWCF